ncbi:glycoside hydrolase family 3 C-terminal domain-containing protein [Acidicapsa dinghuensis]|uniref:Glycoside hydrolase family 3 C-terminal domain-containing protein n=1 Tax=Acidicapsa dinghuensis TaxID=2218256 RepID=A0ABW1EC37_9BACT|nr:glycoside hydrolase family 3 C-terminal domain-containing protein [Acidicapsa dinghuensis]
MPYKSIYLAAALSVLVPFAISSSSASAQSQPPADMPLYNPSLPISQRVDDLVSRMSLEEKVSQLTDQAAAIPRLDVPAYNWWNEGLHGIARSGYATVFPQAIGNAATWDTPLLKQIGTVVSTEARAKYNDAIRHNNHDRYFGLTIWSPNINIFRDPRWGRGQETYGEDPFLTGRLATAFVEGIQGDDPNYFRAIATPKHFAVHSGPESTRHRANVDPTPHDLWDTYLPAFRATITEGKADSLMCAYNAVDGVPACANKLLIQQILRGDWGFQGFITSDCGAVDDFSSKIGHHYSSSNETGSVAAIETGTDTDCGTEYKALTSAVHDKLIAESQLDVSLKRLFTARIKLGMFDPPSQVPYASIPFSVVNSPENQALALRAARESMVLLKNQNGLLPIRPAAGKTLAVIGPLANSRIALEGNYNGTIRQPILPIDGIATEFDSEHVLYAEGSPFIPGGAVPVPRTMFRTTPNSGTVGLTGEYFASPSFEGNPELTRTDKEIDFNWSHANPVPSHWTDTTATSFAVLWTGTITQSPAQTKDFTIHLPDCYPCGGKVSFAIYLDGQLLKPSPYNSDNHSQARADGPIQHFPISFTDTLSHQLRMEYIQSGPIEDSGITLEWNPDADQLRAEAIATAKKADVILAFVGLNPRLEGEEMPVKAKGFSGGDRTDIVLPDVQQQLLQALAATGKPIIVVMLNGSALAVNWSAKNAAAILEAWYPGQSGGQAIAETLSGKNNPAGRLPVTFYTGIDQLPAFDYYSMANRTYRYFKGDPLYRFGDGLSYTTFKYSNLKLSTTDLSAGDTLTAEADVANTGSSAGDDVAELYLKPPHTDVSPQLALAGFQRIHLAPGETRHITFHLDPRTLSQVDDKGIRAVTAGEYRLSLGSSQPTGDAAQSVVTKNFAIKGKQELPR